MNICQLIGQEIELIQNNMLDFDFNNINPNKYDEYIKTLFTQVESLKSLQNVLLGKSDDFEKLDSLISSGVVDIKNLSSKNIATSIDCINGNTVIYLGNIYYSLYRANFITPLPEKLKYVTGTLECEYEPITTIDMEYVGSLKVNNCRGLNSISVKYSRSISILDCHDLSSLRLQTVSHFCDINNCSDLDIKDVQSFYPDTKIELGKLPINTQFTLPQLQSKFNFTLEPYDATFFN